MLATAAKIQLGAPAPSPAPAAAAAEGGATGAAAAKGQDSKHHTVLLELVAKQLGVKVRGWGQQRACARELVAAWFG